MPKNTLSLVAFLILVVGGGSAIGIFNIPGQWYATLTKPIFNPPNWIFGPVWTILYVLIAVAGWRLWTSHRSSLSMKLWWGALVLNFLWSPAFFGLEQTGLALVIILALLITIFLFLKSTWITDKTASWLFVPYAAWVAFASLLNGAIFWLN